MQNDPIMMGGGDVNWYRFINNNSMNYIDPSGLQGYGPAINPALRPSNPVLQNPGNSGPRYGGNWSPGMQPWQYRARLQYVEEQMREAGVPIDIIKSILNTQSMPPLPLREDIESREKAALKAISKYAPPNHPMMTDPDYWTKPIRKMPEWLEPKPYIADPLEDWFVDDPFECSTPDANSTAAKPAPAKLPSMAVNDPVAFAEYKAYKARCGTPLPPGLSACDSARWKLQRNTDCKNMRKAWDDKWFPGRHAGSINELQKSIDNLTEWISKFCKGK